jgi:hypothetical protein
MYIRKHSGKLAHFLRFTIFAVFSCGIFGCRIGNQIIQNQTQKEDQLSGFYLTQPHSLTFYVTTLNTRHQNAPISMIPSVISQHITNPVGLIMKDLITGEAEITSADGTNAFPIFVNQDRSLSFQGVTSKNTFWMEPDCKSFIEFSEFGSLGEDNSVADATNSEFPISGQMNLTIQMVTRFEGDCRPTFQTLSLCYQDENQCGGLNSSENHELQAIVLDMFNPYIQSNVITPSEIADITNYAYEVSYE